MNKEARKAMHKNESIGYKIKTWWNLNSYKIVIVIFFPFFACGYACEKISNYLDSRCEWSEERANKILSYFIPRRAEWHNDDKCFYFSDNGYGWTYNKKFIKLRDHRWWKCNTHFCGGKVREYLIEKFEMDGFRKEVGDTYDQWAEVTFYLIEDGE